MLTVQEAARQLGKNPETIRRWVRSGKLRSRRIGLQHIIDEDDLKEAAKRVERSPLPPSLRKTFTGMEQPDWAEIIRRSRQSH
ncbi:MAG: helix-turn-helix domain-containing protein [Actinomycetota bacterium]